ncbi:asparagine synthase C-terminal domain-containing protein [Streptomyces sp. NPDC050315]|uniref:asparagine synthase C-terminal domain-containing protein n=1 Tax=Streptomyces sp. NPDC050315 TaxID=3155039 RepID=UPI003447AB8A
MPDSCLLLCGPLLRRPSADFVERIIRGVTGGHHDVLTRLPAELSGCVVTPERVVVFRGLSSPDQIFFRRSPKGVAWSSDPRDLIDGRYPEFDKETLWRSCRNDDIFIYPGMGRLKFGELAVLDRHSTRFEQYDPVTPLELPRRTTLREYARITYDLLLEETRPYAHGADGGGKRIGILLSGGVDSSAVLAALVDHGADVIAYHMSTDDPLADESHYVDQVVRHLSVPLVTIPRAMQDDYFSAFSTDSAEWDFPHPFNHAWLRPLGLLGDRVAADGVSILLSGLEGDTVYGPLRYGLHDIIAGDVRRREKWRMLQGMVATRWELKRILRSIRPSYSLYADPEAHAETETGCDFLTPMPNVPPAEYAPDFSAQEHTLNLTLWRPRGIHLGKPWGGRGLRCLAARLPDAYRVIPFAGRTIDKPVLRLAAAHRLPPDVWRHYGRTWLDSPEENWALRHPDVYARILGGPDTRLVALGIVDPRRLTEVLASPVALRRNAESLLSSAMVELFLRDLEKKIGPERPNAGTTYRS